MKGERRWLCWGHPGREPIVPGRFQSAISLLGLGASKSVCTPFKSGVSHSPSKKPLVFKSVKNLVFLVSDLRVGMPVYVVQAYQSVGRIPEPVILCSG